MIGRVLHSKWFYIALLIAAGAWWWLSHAGGQNKNAAPATRVTVAPVLRHDVPVLVPLVGTVVPYETVAVKARLDAEQITDVRFHDGDNVKEGQVLFVLDDRAIRAGIKQMEAALAKEKATLVDDQLQNERMQKLVQTHAVSQSQADDAKAAYDAEAAQVKVAEANLDNARVQLSYSIITAPISGKAGTINVTRGNEVKSNDATLVTINQISPIRVQIAIPQRYYEQVRAAIAAGDVPVVATHKESGESATGKLEYLDNMIDTGNGTFTARAAFANTDEKLWPGMFVNVSLNLGVQKNVLTVPAVAVQGDESKRFVFTVDNANKKAVRKPVEVSSNNGDIAVIASGVDEGDQVITDGILRVSDGASLEVAR